MGQTLPTDEFRNTNPFSSLGLNPLGNNWHKLCVEPIATEDLFGGHYFTCIFLVSKGSGYVKLDSSSP